MYRQATGTRGGALGLMILLLLPLVSSSIGTALTQSRASWALARDGATPFSGTIGKVKKSHRVPANAIIFVTYFNTMLGAIYARSSLAFNVITGLFASLMLLSYLIAILLYLLGGRQSAKPGPFYVKGLLGYVVGAVSSVYLAIIIIFYNCPYMMPVDIDEMNYSCVLFGAMVIFPGLWWIKIRKIYRGPPVEMLV
ncbi:choline transporter [Exophiala viscosa]|uniref:choline transporter n=1 Tax=Exophiala viscosa TaxID=2486360 RepID=UPI002194BCBD|nr:choline transporter [Exophiala viscosa]